MDLEHYTKNRINILKERTTHCVCKYCGGQLHLRRIIFSNTEGARIEIFCEHCNRIEFGVEKEIYQCARNFVEKFNFNCFLDLEDNETTKRMNIAKVCEIITWADQKRGLLDDNGFTTDIHLEDGITGDILFVQGEPLVSENRNLF